MLASAGNGEDLVNQLEELAPLQESGFHSAQEVASAKANLLDAPLPTGRAVLRGELQRNEAAAGGAVTAVRFSTGRSRRGLLDRPVGHSRLLGIAVSLDVSSPWRLRLVRPPRKVQ